jgi:hypothetical protein
MPSLALARRVAVRTPKSFDKMIKIRVRFLGLELALFGVQLARREPSATPGVASGAIRQQSAGPDSRGFVRQQTTAGPATCPVVAAINVKLSNASLQSLCYLKRARRCTSSGDPSFLENRSRALSTEVQRASHFPRRLR